MKKLVIVNITDSSVGVEDLPADVVVEIRDYRTDAAGDITAAKWQLAEGGGWYVARRFGEDL
jgi:hypothetical protein